MENQIQTAKNEFIKQVTHRRAPTDGGVKTFTTRVPLDLFVDFHRLCAREDFRKQDVINNMLEMLLLTSDDLAEFRKAETVEALQQENNKLRRENNRLKQAIQPSLQSPKNPDKNALPENKDLKMAVVYDNWREQFVARGNMLEQYTKLFKFAETRLWGIHDEYTKKAERPLLKQLLCHHCGRVVRKVTNHPVGSGAVDAETLEERLPRRKW